MELTIAICSCLNSSYRIEYLLKTISKLKVLFPNSEYFVGFDKEGSELEDCRCFTHNHGMGYSWNYAIKNASNDYILQLEDDWCLMNENILLESIHKFCDTLSKNNGIFRFEDMTKKTWYKYGYKQSNSGESIFELNRPTSEPDWGKDYSMYYYTNHPQLKHRELHKNIGYYIEDAPPHVVEESMCKTYYDSKEKVFFMKEDFFHHIGTVPAREH